MCLRACVHACSLWEHELKNVIIEGTVDFTYLFHLYIRVLAFTNSITTSLINRLSLNILGCHNQETMLQLASSYSIILFINSLVFAIYQFKIVINSVPL